MISYLSFTSGLLYTLRAFRKCATLQRFSTCNVSTFNFAIIIIIIIIIGEDTIKSFVENV